MTTKKEQLKLKKSFLMFDTNGDGMISREEFLEGYKTLYPDAAKEDVEERANDVFTKADADGSGAIDYTEWSTATMNQNVVLNEASMRAAFRLFDKDGSGTIEVEEIAAILGHKGSNEGEVWSEVLREVDVNGDGEIDFEEFTAMMQKLAETEKASEG